MITIDPSTVIQGVAIIALVSLGADHFRVRKDLSDLRLHVAENYVSSHEIEKIENNLATIAQKLEDMAKQLARMEGAMGMSGKT